MFREMSEWLSPLFMRQHRGSLFHLFQQFLVEYEVRFIHLLLSDFLGFFFFDLVQEEFALF